MAFLAPIVAAVVSGIFAKQQADKNRQQLQKTQQPFLDLQKQNLQFLQPYGQQLAQSGMGNLNEVQSYLQRLMSGDRGLTMQTLAPEINSLTQQYQGSVGAARGLYPRGGQTASQAAQLPYQMQGNINNLLFSARPQAAQQLGQLGSNQASLGMGALGQGGGLTNSMLNYGLNAQNQMFGQGMQIGQGISSLIGPMMQYYMMNYMGRQPSVNNTTLGPYTPSGGSNSFNFMGTPTQSAFDQYGSMSGGKSAPASNNVYSVYGKSS